MKKNSIHIFIFQVFFIVLLHHPVHADWNSRFDRQSAALSDAIPLLQNPKYHQDCEGLRGLRDTLVKDSKLIKQLKESDPNKKIMIFRKDLRVVIKKRRNNHIHDLYAWELSYLIGCEKYVVASFPMEIGGIRVIVQRLESFEFGDNFGGGYSRNTLKDISLETYWKAHIQAYILGFSDLAAANIGVNSKGIIRYFDNEASLIYYNTPFKTDSGFSTGFICHSFDWDQFNASLDASTAKKLRDFVDNLGNFEEDLKTYLTYRPVTISEEGIQYRLNIVRNFNFEKGATFHDFYSTIFPRISAGSQALIQIANKILKRKVGFGNALFFTCRPKRDIFLSEQDKAAISYWVANYIE
jgi:hypothetical protein